MNRITYGLDIAKHTFQLYWVDPDSGVVFNRRFSRKSLIEFLSKRSRGCVALEACGSAHSWARRLGTYGHEVVLIHPRFVRPFVQTNKTDSADAKAICVAAQQPGMRFVAVKTEEQQAVLALHRMRSSQVKFRTAQVNQLRGLLYEFGITVIAGRQAGLARIREKMAELQATVPPLLFEAIKDHLARIEHFDQEIKRLERQIQVWNRQQSACLSIRDIPGIGTLTASALVASIGNVRAFKSGRELAAFIGLVPRHSGTGGKVRLGGISKRGDPYLRTLLIHGARSVIYSARKKSKWVESLLSRRPGNVAVVALANKIVRTVWAVLAHGQAYDPFRANVGT
jgi:transposase